MELVGRDGLPSGLFIDLTKTSYTPTLYCAPLITKCPKLIYYQNCVYDANVYTYMQENDNIFHRRLHNIFLYKPISCSYVRTLSNTYLLLFIVKNFKNIIHFFQTDFFFTVPLKNFFKS